MTIKIGNRVKTHGYYEGIEGIVTRIVPGEDVENHGTVEIRVTKLSNKKFSWLKVGSLEHFVHFDWHKTLIVLPLDTPLLSCHTEKITGQSSKG